MAFGGFSPFPRRFGGAKPLPAQWVLLLRTLYGDAFTSELNSIHGAELIAKGRMLGSLNLLSDKLVANALPGTSYDALLMWAERLGVPVRSQDTGTTIRANCAARYRTRSGATDTHLRDAIDQLMLGAAPVVYYFKGVDLDTPPQVTYDESYQPAGSSVFDLGGSAGGAFQSRRDYILVVVSQPAGMGLADFLYNINVHLASLLSRMLPAYANFGISIDYDGFIVNESLLGYVALK